jgi:hypothetical protein
LKLTIFIIIIISVYSHAGRSLHPAGIIKRLIYDVDNEQANISIWVDLSSVKKQLKNPMSKIDIIKSFKNLKSVTFRTEYQKNRQAIVRMLTPKQYKFELKHYCNEALKGTSKPACRYKVYSIQPE